MAPARSSGCLFPMWCIHSSSGWITCPDRFCPEDLPVCPATTMAAHIYECHEELLQGPCYPAEVCSPEGIFRTQAPRTRHRPFREEWESFIENFSSAEPTLHVLSDQTLPVMDERKRIPQDLQGAKKFSILKPFAKEYS